MSPAVWTWFLFAISVFGAWLSGRSPRAGWIYNIMIQTLAWGPYAFLTNQPGLVGMSIVFVLLSAWSLWRWRGTPFIPATQRSLNPPGGRQHPTQPASGASS